MKIPPILVLDYGMGNIHSIIKALKLYYPEVRYGKDKNDILSAIGIVLPGDGAFPAAMANISDKTRHQLDMYLQSKGALLGICIGFQILFQNSNENFPLKNTHLEDDTKVHDFKKFETKLTTTLHPGLGYIEGYIRDFASHTKENEDRILSDASDEKQFRIPHMGWNQLISHDKHLNKNYMYFIHSYRALKVPEENILAYCEYAGERFPALVKKENILASQFHPEKSGNVGLKLIQNWVEGLEQN